MPKFTFIFTQDHADAKFSIPFTPSREIPREEIEGKTLSQILGVLRETCADQFATFETKIGSRMEDLEFLRVQANRQEPFAIDKEYTSGTYMASLNAGIFLFRLEKKRSGGDSSSSSSSSSSAVETETGLIENRAFAALSRDLRNLTTAAPADADARTIVFIGVGSWNPYAHNAVRADKQQCPEKLVALCEQYGFSLKILLVDNAFPGSPEAQVFARSGWTRISADREAGIATYKRGLASRSAASGSTPELTLTTYQTRVDEYEDLNAGRLAGIPIAANLALHDTEYDKSRRIALICGNFFEICWKSYFISADEAPKVEIAHACDVLVNSPRLSPAHHAGPPEPLSLEQASQASSGSHSSSFSSSSSSSSSSSRPQ